MKNKFSNFIFNILGIVLGLICLSPFYIIIVNSFKTKGELFEKCSNKFKSEGYEVKVLDLRNPSQSMQWNPLTYPYQM